jgi:hypothetical protein
MPLHGTKVIIRCTTTLLYITFVVVQQRSCCTGIYTLRARGKWQMGLIFGKFNLCK